jgi:hypothetical protein
MRHRWPQGRIIHELNLEQYGIRLDLACVTEDRLVIAEIKSERDKLTRLVKQAAKADEVACETWVVLAEKHRAGAEELRAYWKGGPGDREARMALGRARFWIERGPAGELIDDMWCSGTRAWRPPRDPRAMFDLLWAAEQHAALRRFWGVSAMKNMTRDRMTFEAVEHMSGREIRRAVCAALRNRTFARADPPVSQLQEPADEPPPSD